MPEVRREKNNQRKRIFNLLQMKTQVLITGYSPHGEYKSGDRGIVDGYISGGDGTPCAVVIIGKRFILVPVYQFVFDGFVEV